MSAYSPSQSSPPNSTRRKKFYNGELPDQFRVRDDFEAVKRLITTTAFCLLAAHALSLSPVWALPLCWIFAAVAFTFVFEIGHDCARNQFFRAPLLNKIGACLLLAPLAQPSALWSDDQPLKSWSAGAFGYRKSMKKGFHVSHAVVILFAAVFFPVILSRPDGAWELMKFWAIPLTLFHFWMVAFFNEGRKLAEENDDFPRRLSDVFNKPSVNGKPAPLAKDDKDANLQAAAELARKKAQAGHPSELRLYLRLLAYLRFQLHVPSYHFSDAIYFLKRVWAKSFDDAPTGTGPNGKPDFVENLALGALKTGFTKLKVFDSALSLMLKLLVVVWLWLVVKSQPEELWNLQNSAWAESFKSGLSGFWNEPAIIMGAAIDVKIALVSSCIILLVLRSYYVKREVYLVDFVTYTPPPECIVTTDMFLQLQRRHPFSQQALEFMDKLIVRTGLGEQTYFPPNILQTPADCSLAAARHEAEMVMFGCLDELFSSTNTKPKDVDILVVNCSLFNPTPSLSAMIINKYKMREDIQSYNLAGMGCSAGVIAVHLAKDLLNVYPRSLAVVVSMENITQNWYKGNERGMLMSNCLFRMGGAAVLLSNKGGDAGRAKYKLLHTVRTHRGADDQSYYAVYQDCDNNPPYQPPSAEGANNNNNNHNHSNHSGHAHAHANPDSHPEEPNAKKAPQWPAGEIPPGLPHVKDGVVQDLCCSTTENVKVGVRLSKDLMKVAGEALKHNITSLAPLILPLSEQVRYLHNLFLRKAMKRKMKPYVPNFKKAVQHFCIHAGGRAVIEAIEEALQLGPKDVEPSKATLHRFGNTSSSSIWYELAFIEKNGRIKRNEKVWQIAFGSGFKCNSAVWQAL